MKAKDIREYLTAASIAAYREQTIEECARMADLATDLEFDQETCEQIAAAIRALKDKP